MSSAPATPPTELVLDQALALAAIGLRVVPIKPSGVHPPMNSWQHAATDNVDVITNWFNGFYRNHGLGIAMGPQPGGFNLIAIDVDVHPDAPNGYDSLHELEGEHGELPTTWRSLSGGGGTHILLRVPDDIVVRNQQAGGNRIAPGIDVRGTGGQIVIAPSLHHRTGRVYAWEIGCEPWEIPVADCPAWLLERVREPDLLESAPFVTPLLPASASNGDSIAESVRDDWDWPTELAGRGWTLARRSGGDTYWTRPGKNPRDGHSAVLHGHTHLVVFTTEIPESWRRAGRRTTDGSGYSFSPFGFIAATEHGGDRSATAEALREAQRRHPTASAAPNLNGAPSGTQTPISDDPDDWAPHDIAEIAGRLISGEYKPELPEYLAVDGGIPLLYPGRVHSIFGEPSGGKTWIALAAIAERLQHGDFVLMIDWEDSPQGTIARLLQLGCSLDDLTFLDYRNPVTGLARGWQAINVGDVPWALVVIDSTGEAMAAGGINPNDDGPVAEWMALAKRLARTGAAVLLLDHVPKNVENRDMEIGSQRKQAAITGASYRCDTVISPAKGRNGKLKLIVRKDRLGTRPKGATAAEVHFVDGEPLRIELRISVAQEAADRGERFRPTVLMEKVSRWLEFHPGVSRRTIEKEVTGNGPAIRAAIDILIQDGYVMVAKVGQTHEHTVARPYSEAFDNLLKAVDNSVTEQPRPTASNRVQTASMDAVVGTASTASPSLYRGTRLDAVHGLFDDPTASPVDNPEPITNPFMEPA